MKLRELTCEVNTIQIELKRKIARLHSKYFKCKTAKQHIHKMTVQNRLQCDITKNPTKIELLCKEEDNTHTTYTQQSAKLSNVV